VTTRHSELSFKRTDFGTISGTIHLDEFQHERHIIISEIIEFSMSGGVSHGQEALYLLATRSGEDACSL
jgi:hypothetical protein